MLGTAIASKAETIVTFNLRDFPPAALSPWNIQAKHPDAFLVEILRRHPAETQKKVQGMVRRHGPEKTLEKLRRDLPTSAKLLARNLA